MLAVAWNRSLLLVLLWCACFWLCLVMSSVHIGASHVFDLWLVETSWLYKGSLCAKLERVPSPLDHGSMSPSSLCSKIHVCEIFLSVLLCQSSTGTYFYSVGLPILFSLWITTSVSLHEFNLLMDSSVGSYQELGGNSLWIDCFLARFMAFFYYFVTVAMYMLSPRMACKYSYLPIVK